MTVSRQPLVPFALALLVAACSQTTGPASPQATVTVQRESVPVAMISAGSVTRIEFTIPVSIHNAGPKPLTYVLCASGLELRAGIEWSRVWTPICSAETDTPLAIPAGGRREFALSVSASMQGPGGPEWGGDGISGTYRLVAGLMPSGVEGVVPTVASNAFTLVSSK